MKWLVNALIKHAMKRPFTHLLRADGTPYMLRYWLIPYSWNLPFAVKIHHICSPDVDRVLHDHPWDFISVVLRGYYIEAVPHDQAMFHGDGPGYITHNVRREGTVARRLATDRHRIATVSEGGVWTMFVTFRKRQSWGFYTEEGKIWWWIYASSHEAFNETGNVAEGENR